jgi:hypothetical protein
LHSLDEGVRSSCVLLLVILGVEVTDLGKQVRDHVLKRIVSPTPDNARWNIEAEVLIDNGEASDDAK